MSVPIIFETVRFKNFLSYPNYFTEIKLNDPTLALIVGKSGSGKSTLLDAIMFALFGKPYKKINKQTIVNSLNNKDCVVEIEFSVGPTHYKVVRGLKPAKFEIYEDGVLKDQNSKGTEEQKLFERDILGGISYNTFSQICVLGSANFVPFMQLDAKGRRDLVENLLNLDIFKTCLEISKKKINDKEQEIIEKSTEIRILDNSLKEKKNSMLILFKQKQKAEVSNDSIVQNIVDDIEANGKSKLSLIDDLEAFKGQMKAISDDHDLDKASLQNDEERLKKIAVETKSIRDMLSLWDKGNCPTCKQVLPKEGSDVFDYSGSLKICETNFEILKNDGESVKSRKSAIQKYDDILENAKRIVMKIKQIDETISKLNAQIESIKEQKIESFDDSLISTEQSKIDDVEAEIAREHSAKIDLEIELKYLKLASTMFKDTGIKSKIIKVFIPMMNEKMNSYLSEFDMDITFECDENFKEIIKGRGRDDYGYNNLSEGEKKRIDLAILFTWLEIAELKNSLVTNLLVADELMDSSLDFDGVNNLVDILKRLCDKGKSIFIISHRPELSDLYFDKTLTVSKTGYFSNVE